MKNNVILVLLLMSYPAFSDSYLMRASAKGVTLSSTSNPVTPITLTSNLCHDILNKNPNSEDGNYLVDPDLDGPLPEKSAYCLMSQGGWTLYDGFGSEVSEKITSANAYNYKGISKISDLALAGYTNYQITIENQYIQKDYPGYVEFHNWNPSTEEEINSSYIEKTIPNWSRKILIKYTTFGFLYIYMNNELVTSKSAEKYSYNNFLLSSEKLSLELTNNGPFKIKEINGVIFIDSVWVM